ncbi:MAG TPA: hypothetical protein VGZ73_22950 [Bryobacteraceae bacterium]|jgi:hypothetical protein|nr:hypothetical protein [Bryobacteraceae bacterium]
MMITRTIFAALLLASSALAGPPLTTIQDVLYKADGTRFNGTLAIAWSSFQATDTSAIATQRTIVKVVDGNLLVQLVPTTGSTPPVVYTVTYNSDGRVQFQETWAVPTSTRPIRLRDVRIAASGVTSSDTGSGTGPLDESAVVGLTADLAARPVKGPGYAASRAAIVNATGSLESASGVATDCVRVDGSSGPCGGGQAASFADAESPSGIVDGANAQFTLSGVPNPASSLSLYRNGLLQMAGQDYILNGQTLAFVSSATPQPGDTLLAWYRLSGGGDGTVSFVDSDSPSGTLDGVNSQFTLSAAPNPAPSLAVFRNGLLQKIGQDYTLNGPALTFASGALPQSGDTLLASYRLSGNGPSPSQTYPSSQLLCGGTGGATTAAVLSSLGTCFIPAGLLLPGDRIEVRFDLEHQGATSGFSFEVHWGGTVVARRDAVASDTLVTGRADAGILPAGAQLSFQSWGAVLPFTAGVASAADAYATGLAIDFLGKLALASGDTLTLRNFAVVRLP